MLVSPLAARNQDGLLEVLEEVLDEHSHRQLFALELGSGTGQHVVHFAMKMPFVTWQPSDIQEESFDSIKAYIKATNLKTVLKPICLDASEPWEKWASFTQGSCDVIVAINLLQYSPFKTAEGVFKGAGEILHQNGVLIVYGAYAINGTITPATNEELDQEIKQKNPEWGLPDIDVLRQLAYGNSLRLERIIEMEDYNKSLIFRKL